MTDLDQAIRWILSTHGHNVILQRRNVSGIGWRRQKEQHTARHMYPNSRGLASVRDEEPEGIVNVVDMLYFFLPNAKPREGDRIYEKDERFEGYIADGTNTNSGFTTWLVDYSLPLKGRGGKIVFWTVGVTRESPN